MEDPLRRQQAFDDLVAVVLARFASSVGSDIDGHVQSSLREIAQFIGVDYAFLIRISEDLAAWSATHEWFAPGVPSQLEKYQNVPMGTFGWTERAILAGEVVLLNSLDDLPLEADPVRRRLEALGFKSTLQVPLRRQGGFISGCIALSSIRHEMAWAEKDVRRLRLVGEAVANALERKRVEEELRESETRFRTTFEQAPVGILNVALDGRVLEANQRFCDMLGYSPEELLGTHVRDFTHPSDCLASASLYEQSLADRGSVQSLDKRYLRKDGGIVWGNLTLSLLCSPAGEPQTFVAAIEDITARKAAETELREALQEVERLTERLRAENVYLQEEIASSQGFDEIVGESEPLRLTLTKIEHVANTDASVLLLG